MKRQTEREQLHRSRRKCSRCHPACSAWRLHARHSWPDEQYIAEISASQARGGRTIGHSLHGDKGGYGVQRTLYLPGCGR